MKELRGAHKIAESKHQSGVDDLCRRLLSKSYVDDVLTNKVINGYEIDLLVRTELGWTPWEYKTNHTKKGYYKAKKQLGRSVYLADHITYKSSGYGVYATSTTAPRIIIKGYKLVR